MWFNFIQRKAQTEGLWNLFLPGVSGLSQLEYALLAEVTGRCPFAPEVFNCSAPGTFHMIILSKSQCGKSAIQILKYRLQETYHVYDPQQKLPRDLNVCHMVHVSVVMAFNKKGRCYERGKGLWEEWKGQIIDKILESFGDGILGYFPTNWTELDDKFRVLESAKNVWQKVQGSFI